MDKHDEQFETFLRQFRLRKPGPLPARISGNGRSAMRWIFAAAAVVLLAVAGSLVLIRNHRNAGSPSAVVEAAGNPSLYKAGEIIGAGTLVQSNSAVGLVLALEDGSHIEMRSQSQLALESAADGIRVRLNDGSILVTAAKQGSGHLYVQTRDSLVSVVGTVFFVSTETTGTRVAVVEGEVHVQQGTELKKLLPGEQAGSNPALTLKPVAEEIAWSRNAATYVAMLQQPSGPAPTAPKSPQEPSAKYRFDRDCSGCHYANLAEELSGRASQFSVSDRALLSEKQAEVSVQLKAGKKETHPDVLKLRLEIAQLAKRADASPQNFDSFASRHLADVRKRVPYDDTVKLGDEELLALSKALATQFAAQRQVSPASATPEPAAVPSPKPEEEKEPKKEDPDAAGEKLLNSACTTCHDLGPIVRRAEDKASWEGIVTGMVGYGADIKDSDIQLLVDYLFRHYGPPKDTPKTPDAPAAPAAPLKRP